MTSESGLCEESRDVAARLRLVLLRLTRLLRRQGSAGLTPSQISALATLEEFGPLRISSLATHESISAPVATRSVAIMEEQGWLQRTDDPDDKRACLVEMTPFGREVLENIWHERIQGLSARLDRLTARERAQVRAALGVLEKLVRED